MSSFKKANPELDDRDRIARHRNLMCEIALKKQITQMQREGQILEREMREIKKVKETLKQLQKPIKKRLCEDQIFTENRYEKEELKAAVNLIGGHGIVQALPQRSEQQKQRKPKQGRKVLSNKTAKTSTVRFCSNYVSPHCDILTSAKGTQIKENENSTVAELSGINAAQETKRCQIIQVAPCQEIKSKELVDKTVSSDQSSTVQHLENIPRPRSSKILSVEAAVPVQRSCKSSCAVDTFHEMTLTMEETLRIKGKFRQIGHSVIAGALLKGLKQRNALTSEAIHNLHQTVSLDTPTPNGEEKTKEIEEANAIEEKSPTDRFRKAVRKTMILNRVFSVASNGDRPRSFSSPESFEAVVPCSHEKLRKKSLMNASASRTRQWRKYGGAVHALQILSSGNRKVEQKLEQNSMIKTDDIQNAMEGKEAKDEEETSFFPVPTEAWN